MNTERDELAEIIWRVEADEIGTFKTGVTSKAADDIADAIIAAGWRPPTPPAHAIEVLPKEERRSMIPDEAVEAAAKALSVQAWGQWEYVPSGLRKAFLRDAKITLEAAAPYIKAQAFREAAADIDERRPEMGPEINITDYRRGREAALVLAAHVCRARAAAELEESGAE